MPCSFDASPTSSQGLIRDEAHSVALSQEICSLLKKGAIEKVHPLVQRDSFYSTYFPVPKETVVFIQFFIQGI